MIASRIVIPACLAVAALLAGLSPQSRPAQMKVEGSVDDYSTRKGLDTVKVIAVDDQDREVSHVFTNADGKYRISVDPGKPRLHYSLKGYKRDPTKREYQVKD